MLFSFRKLTIKEGKKQSGKKEGKWKEGRKEGKKEGRKEGMKEGRKEGRDGWIISTRSNLFLKHTALFSSLSFVPGHTVYALQMCAFLVQTTEEEIGFSELATMQRGNANLYFHFGT